MSKCKGCKGEFKELDNDYCEACEYERDAKQDHKTDKEHD